MTKRRKETKVTARQLAWGGVAALAAGVLVLAVNGLDADEPPVEPVAEAAPAFPDVDEDFEREKAKIVKRKFSLPQFADPAKQERALDVALERERAKVRAQERVQRQVSFEAPAELKRVNPEAAAMFERRGDLQRLRLDKHRKNVRDLEELQRMKDAARALAASREGK